MKFFSTKFLISSFLALNAASANATIYRLTFSTSDFTNITGNNGTLSGFILIDDSLADANYTKTTENFTSVPSWITDASFTFTNTSGDINSPTVTRTISSSPPLTGLLWATAGGSPDYSSSANFLTSMSALAFRDDFNDFVGGTSGQIGQQVHDDEFIISGLTIATEAVPGPLPLLGLAPLAYYFKKLKKKPFKI